MSYNQDEIAKLVERVVKRTMGNQPQRTIINEDTIRDLPRGSTYVVPKNALITPLANQIALENNIKLVEDQATEKSPELWQSDEPLVNRFTDPSTDTGQKLIALGADHGGFELKVNLKALVAEAGYGVIDCGTNSAQSVDYPDYAYAVSRLVADGRAWRGIIIDGAGIGSCMAANKVPGVRAAMCYDQATAVNSREHNNANVLTLGAGLIGPNLANQIVLKWLSTDFGGGRHARRVDKIDAIGERYLKKSSNRD